MSKINRIWLMRCLDSMIWHASSFAQVTNPNLMLGMESPGAFSFISSASDHVIFTYFYLGLFKVIWFVFPRDKLNHCLWMFSLQVAQANPRLITRAIHTLLMAYIRPSSLTLRTRSSWIQSIARAHSSATSQVQLCGQRGGDQPRRKLLINSVPSNLR